MPDKDHPIAKLAPRHRRFIKNQMKGFNQEQSAVKAGYAPSYGAQLMNQPIIRNELAAQMAKAGITDTLLAKKLRDGLNAKTPPKREGGTQYEDQFVRKQFLDVIFKLRGDYSPERKEVTEKRITIMMDAAMVKSLKDSRVLSEEECTILDAEVINEPEAGETPEPRLLGGQVCQ
jgi:phage terminase small subunit